MTDLQSTGAAMPEVKQHNDKQVVDARELHAYLDVGRDFTNWIKGRIDEYGFIDGQDFEVSAKTGENPKGGRPSKDYHVSIDMAKELGMVERTEKGRAVRKYFIETEKQWRQQVSDNYVQKYWRDLIQHAAAQVGGNGHLAVRLQMSQSELRTAKADMNRLTSKRYQELLQILERIVSTSAQKPQNPMEHMEGLILDLPDAELRKAFFNAYRDLPQALESGKESELNSLKNMLEVKTDEVKTLRREARMYKQYYNAYVRFEASRIRKKNEQNRTPAELALLEEAENLNGQGGEV